MKYDYERIASLVAKGATAVYACKSNNVPIGSYYSWKHANKRKASAGRRKRPSGAQHIAIAVPPDHPDQTASAVTVCVIRGTIEATLATLKGLL